MRFVMVARTLLVLAFGALCFWQPFAPFARVSGDLRIGLTVLAAGVGFLWLWMSRAKMATVRESAKKRFRRGG